MKPNEGISYSLTDPGSDSDNYYAAITAFGEYLIPKMEEAFGAMADRYIDYLQKVNSGQVSSREVYLYESLMLGIFWNVYGGFAEGTNHRSVRLMKQMALLRTKGGIRRRVADMVRAGLAFRLLEKQSLAGRFLFPGTTGMEKLIQWMQSTGEFRKEAEIFSNWLRFLRQEDETFAFVGICKVRAFARFFASESDDCLGEYTQNVNQFRQQILLNRHLREDKISVNKQKVEYHLNMMGAFIYNRALQSDFNESKRKIVLLPACMKANPPAECKAEKAGLGEHCTGCSGLCQINHITHLGKKHHFTVEIVKHSSDISLTKQSIPDGCGLIGVACVSTVISGGLELIQKKFPAQCVLLDYCGCRHWSEKTIPTSLNLNELLSRVNSTSLILENHNLKNEQNQDNIAA